MELVAGDRELVVLRDGRRGRAHGDEVNAVRGRPADADFLFGCFTAKRLFCNAHARLATRDWRYIRFRRSHTGPTDRFSKLPHVRQPQVLNSMYRRARFAVAANAWGTVRIAGCRK